MSLPGSSVCGVVQARILEWVAIPFSKGSSWPRDQTSVFCITGRFFMFEPSGKPQNMYVVLQRAFIYIGCICLFITMLLLCSVTQLCPTLCDPMDCSTPDFLSFMISWSLLKLMSIKLVMPSNPLNRCRPFSCLQSFPASESFLRVFCSGGQSIGASALVLPMNIQGWFLLGLTGLISLQSKAL